MKTIRSLGNSLLPVGPRSILFGAHCWFLHPLFVWRAWWQLYGFPRDPRLYVAFCIHDWGYLFQWCREMDSDEGELHPIWAARVMHRLFGLEWGQFCLFHSRFLAKRYGAPYSRLAVADKLAIALTPAWLYLPLATLSGEVHEYMATYGTRTISGETHPERLTLKNKRDWFSKLQPHMRAWAETHKDGRPDSWTNRQPIGESGVYQ